MSQYFTITLPSNSSPGPYNIYYNFLNNGFLAPIYNTTGFAENLALTQLITGVTVVVPDNTTLIYLYNNSDCDSLQEFPIETPTPDYGSFCLSYNCIEESQQFQFSWNGSVYNGKPVFSASGGYNLVWVTGSTPNYWEISGLTSPIIRSTNPNIPPVNSWQGYNLTGACKEFNISISYTSGLCPTSAGAGSIKIETSNPTCSNNSDGGITINPYGGNPPYSYSLDGVNYTPSPVFPGLSSGPYTVYSKDVSGSVVAQNVNLVSPPNSNHQMNVNQLSFSQISQVGNIKYYQIDYSITPDVILPLSTVVNLDLYLEYNLSYIEPGTPTFYTSGNTISKGAITLTPTLTSTTPLTPNGFSTCNPLYNKYDGQDVYLESLTYQNGDTISGTSVFGIDSYSNGVLSGTCFTNSTISLNLRTEITNVDCDCCNVVGNNVQKNINVTYFSYT
jgi:hypothetical protein